MIKRLAGVTKDGKYWSYFVVDHVKGLDIKFVFENETVYIEAEIPDNKSRIRTAIRYLLRIVLGGI